MESKWIQEINGYTCIFALNYFLERWWKLVPCNWGIHQACSHAVKHVEDGVCQPATLSSAEKQGCTSNSWQKTWIKREYFIHSCQRKGIRVTLRTAGMCCCLDFEPWTHCLFNEHTGSEEQVGSELDHFSIGRNVPTHHQNQQPSSISSCCSCCWLENGGNIFFLCILKRWVH